MQTHKRGGLEAGARAKWALVNGAWGPILALAGAASCSSQTAKSPDPGTTVAGAGAGGGATGGTSSGAGGSLASGGTIVLEVGGQGADPPPDDGRSPVIPCNGPCRDFPTDPTIVPSDTGTSLPPDIATRFGTPSTGAAATGVCLVEPEPESLLPRNWLRPRIRLTAAPTFNAFEYRIHSDHEANDWVIYSPSSTWYMPKEIWSSLCSHVGEEWVVTVSVRALDTKLATAMPVNAGEAKITIAPAEAKGSIVYWTTASSSSLKGFQAGDENVVTALLPTQVRPESVACIGCHTSTPDGKFASLVETTNWNTALSSLEPTSVGALPPYLGPGALPALEKTGGALVFSAGHWADGDRVGVARLNYQDLGILSPLFPPNGMPGLAWFDLEATSSDEGKAYGMLARNGDAKDATFPTWSHSGDTIVYVSSERVSSGGILQDGTADLYGVPFNNRAGGDAAPIPGAADPMYNEYYPAYSGDDALLAFNRIDSGAVMYNAPEAEVFVIPGKGGTATRLRANDPPACASSRSPGVTNSWPKWSPEVQTVGGKAYHWLIFSSTRSELHNPQLYVTGVVTSAGESAPKTYGAVYLWNQPADEANHTPAWDVFKLPPTPPPKDPH